MLKLKKLKLFALTAALIASAVQVLPAQAAAADNGLQKEKVWFTRSQDNLKLAGEMYYPQNFNKNQKYPAIVVVHPGGGVKEQTAAIYAKKLAQKGFVTLAYDAAYQGESEAKELPAFWKTLLQELKTYMPHLIILTAAAL